MQSEDDKEISNQSVWNSSVICDATLEAVLVMLLDLKDRSSENYKYTMFWPDQYNNSIWEDFQWKFYKALAERPLPLFKTHCGWKTYKECTFLHPKVCADEKLKNIAFEVLKENSEGKVVVDLPDNIFQRFEIYIGTDFENAIVTYEHSIIALLLPSICNYQGHEYDEIVVNAIKSKHGKILAAIKKTECISTLAAGIRKAPGHLVHPESSLKDIFLPNQEYFPEKNFCKGEVLDILVELGMIKEKIPWEVLVMQAESVALTAVSCFSCASRCSNEIVKYLHTFFDQMSEETRKKMSDIQFLPSKKKPKDWPWKWYTRAPKQTCVSEKCTIHRNDEYDNNGPFQYFVKPSNLFFQTNKNLVGCTEAILDCYTEEDLYSVVLKSIGVKCRRDIKPQTLKLQLKEIIENSDDVSSGIVEEICFAVYAAFEENLIEREWQEFVRNEFSELRCVLIGKTFVYAKQVFFALGIDCSPHLYGIETTSLGRYSKLMETLGVRKKIDSDEIVQILSKLKEQYEDEQLSATDLSLVCRMIKVFEDFDSISSDELCLPDTNGHLRTTSRLCMNDFEWIPNSDSMYFLHEKVSPKVAKLSGIKSKREHSVLEDSEEFGYKFGQNEDLTNRIKSILDGYPDNDILQELLQNADDSGASELHFIIDERNHGIENVFSDKWAEIQGPALCVFNDSIFTEDNLIGIQKLGIGSKRDDPVAAGQYGVGFNVVYHLTDVPSFLTRDLEKSLDTLCILDPHCEYVLGSSIRKPGRMFPNVSKTVRVKYGDIMPCYLEDTDVWRNSRGTLFRFPLRQRNDSKLSQKTYSCKNIERMFEELQNKAPECLLFLHNIESIIFSKITISESLERIFHVHAKSENILPREVSLISHLVDAKQQMGKNPIEICKAQQTFFKSYLEIDINGLQKQKWLIVNGFGFCSYYSIPYSIREAYNSGQLVLLPCAGVAVLLRNDNTKCEEEDGGKEDENLSRFKAFCVLPLPNTTGLPLHINGHFVIDSETRKHIFWVQNEYTDVKFDWNKCLVRHVLVPTYAFAVEHLRDMLFNTDIIEKNNLINIVKFYKIFPNIRNAKNNICKFIAAEVYKYLFQNNCNVLPIFRKYDTSTNITTQKCTSVVPDKKNANTSEPELLRVTWKSMQDATFCNTYFDTYAVQLGNIPELMKIFGMQIAGIPNWICDSIEDIRLNVKFFSPVSVIKFLKTFKDNDADKFRIIGIPVTKTAFKDCKTVCQVLEYCVEGNESRKAELMNLPLLLTSDECIRVFSTNRKVLLTDFPDLFPKSADQIAHTKELHILRKNYCTCFFADENEVRIQKKCYKCTTFSDFVQELSIKNFFEYFSKNIGEEMLQSIAIKWCHSSEEMPNKKWMHTFWKFLSKQFKAFEHRLKRESTEKHISMEFCFKEFSKLLLSHLEKCNLLPVAKGKNGLYVFPLGSGRNVLLTKGYEREHDALLNMNIPLIDLQCLPADDAFACSLLNNLVANMHDVTSVLECLQENSSTLLCTKKSVDTMLNYLKEELVNLQKEEKNNQILRNLPIYFTITKKFMSAGERTIILLSEEIPKNGLEELGDKTKIIFLDENKSFRELYEFLGFMEPNKCDLYITHIIPNMQLLPIKAIVGQLKFIRDSILPHILNSQMMDERKEKIRKLLCETAFLMKEDNCLAKACEFYNPHQKLFSLENQLCLTSELPPKPFNEKVWKDFLIFSGMLCEINITAEIFVKFAKRLETLADKTGISDVVQRNSNHLLNILFSGPFELSEDRTILRKVRELRFICPYKMDDICVSLLKQYTDTRRLIRYSEATLPSNCLIAWSQMDIVSKKANPFFHLQDCSYLTNVIEELNIRRNPTLESVVNHIDLFCSSLHPLLEQSKPEIVKQEQLIAKVMQEAYKYLSEYGNAWSVERLSVVPFVFLKERKMLTTPNHVVLNMNEKDELLPFICKASVFFGQFHELFNKYGAAVDATSSHYAKVLSEIKSMSGDRELRLDELDCIRKAIKGLFTIRRSENKDVQLCVSKLYLLTKENKLEDSKEMVFIDNMLLQKRIGVNMPTFSFFIGFKALYMDVKDQMSGIKLLPEQFRPQLLSKLVTEDLEVNSKKIRNSVTASCLKKFICCPEFLEGMNRIIVDRHSRCEMSFSEAEQRNVECKLKNISFTQLEFLTTVLLYEDEVLPNTEETNTIFAKRNTIECVEMLSIYFTVHECTSLITWMDTNSISMSTQINDYLDNILGDRIIFLPKILECFQNPAVISGVLDSLKVLRSDESLPGPSIPPEILPVPYPPIVEIGPQPEEAKRWISQAEKDFTAASNDCLPASYNWACYKCHQAAEKALKALWYEKGGIERVHSSHDLSELVSSFDDSSLPDLIYQLEGVTGSYFRMRYPDAVSESLIPSQIYTQSDATRAKELTKKILDIVRTRISRH